MIHLLLRREIAVEQSRQEDGVVGDCQRHCQTDEQVRDDDDRDLLGAGERAVPAVDTSTGRRSEGGDQGQDDGRRDAGHARRVDTDEKIRESDAGGDRHGGADPPEHVEGVAPPAAPFADDGQRHHLDDDGEGDGDAGQAGGFDEVGRQRGQELRRVDGDAQDVDGEHGEQEDDGVDPEDGGDDSEAAELVVELVQDDGDDAGPLWDEEPLRGEITEDAREAWVGGESVFAVSVHHGPISAPESVLFLGRGDRIG